MRRTSLGVGRAGGRWVVEGQLLEQRSRLMVYRRRSYFSRSRVWNVWVVARLGDRLISLFEYGGQLLETVSTGAIGTLNREGEGYRYRGQHRVGKHHAGKCTSNCHGGALAVVGEGAEKRATRFAIAPSPKHLKFRRTKKLKCVKKTYIKLMSSLDL